MDARFYGRVRACSAQERYIFVIVFRSPKREKCANVRVCVRWMNESIWLPLYLFIYLNGCFFLSHILDDEEGTRIFIYTKTHAHTHTMKSILLYVRCARVRFFCCCGKSLKLRALSLEFQWNRFQSRVAYETSNVHHLNIQKEKVSIFEFAVIFVMCVTERNFNDRKNEPRNWCDKTDCRTVYVCAPWKPPAQFQWQGIKSQLENICDIEIHYTTQHTQCFFFESTFKHDGHTLKPFLIYWMMCIRTDLIHKLMPQRAAKRSLLWYFFFHLVCDLSTFSQS